MDNPLLLSVKKTTEYKDRRYNNYAVMNRFVEDKQIAMFSISKCACSTIFYNSMRLRNIYDISDINQYEYKHFSHWKNTLLQNLTFSQDLNKDEYYYIAIFRDPIERLVSAYYTLTIFYQKDMNYEQYVKYLIDAFKQDEYYVNRHVLSQFDQYDIEAVDLFVHINNLSRYFLSINIENIHINKSILCFKNIQLPINNELKSLLERDYEIYNNILNSDKLFK